MLLRSSEVSLVIFFKYLLRFVLFTTVKQIVVIKWKNARLEIKKYLNIVFVMESLIVLMSRMNRDALVSTILGIFL